MDIEYLMTLRDIYSKYKSEVSGVVINNHTTNFDITYTHESTAMEGNTLTLLETKVLLEDHISVGGKALREIYEVVNHNKAYQYVKKSIEQDKKLSESMIKDIHQMLTENIMPGGVYRRVDVYISGAQHTPPTPNEMYKQVKYYYDDLTKSQEQNPIQFAAWCHAEFVRIHPFEDGNGRTARLIMNYILMENRFLPVSIPTEMRLNYYSALEEYAINDNLTLFANLIAELEEKRLNEFIRSIQQRPG